MNATSDEYLLPGGGTSINALPKISLHDHLDGGLRPQTIIELADAIGLELPATDAAGLGSWFEDQSNSGSLVEYLKTFDLTTAVMQTREGLFRVAKEFAEDLGRDGVIYGEVRWAPEQHLTRGLTLDQAVEAVQEGLDAGCEHAAAVGDQVRTGQLVTAMRHANRGMEIAELAVRHRENGVVGFDIAGAELGFPARNHLAAFDFLAKEFLPVTVHAGEADGLESIRGALFDGRALRLGHGVRLAEDITIEREDNDNTYVTLGPIAQWVRDREITLELSPSSNLQTGAVAQWGDDLPSHPFDLLYQLGFHVTVNPDNRLMSNTSVTKELALLTDAFGYDIDDLLAFQLNAAQSAFLPLEDREELMDSIIAGFEDA